MAPLLPKLRGYFAEFLNKGSSARLRILFLPTCVGFGTGTCILDSVFSRQHGIMCFSTCFSIPIIPYFSENADLPTFSGLVFGRTFPCRAGKLILLRHHFSNNDY